MDPIQDDLESAVKWASEFKRLQQEIIELWHACCVSLVHRTYFFLLFKGDPKDSFYMEVELRKLSFLKETFSRGHETLVDGRSLSLASRYISYILNIKYIHKHIDTSIFNCNEMMWFFYCKQQEGFKSREADAM